MAHRVDPTFFNHPRHVNQSNFNFNNSQLVSPNVMQPRLTFPMQPFPHHHSAIQQTFSSQPLCHPASQLQSRWPTAEQVPHYAVPQECAVQRYVHVPSNQYSTQPMILTPVYYQSTSQFCHCDSCNSRLLQPTPSRNLTPVFNQLTMSSNLVPTTGIYPNQQLAIHGHDTGCTRSAPPPLIKQPISFSPPSSPPALQIVVEDTEEQDVTKEKTFPPSSTQEQSLMQGPNNSSTILTSHSTIHVVEQSTSSSLKRGVNSMSAGKHHIYSDSMLAAAASSPVSFSSSSKLPEDDRLIVSIPISILQCVPKPSSSFLKPTTDPCSDVGLVMEKLNELLKESPLLSNHDCQTIQDFFRGSACTTSSHVCRYALKKIHGPGGISKVICLELDFSTKVWRGFCISDSEIRKHKLWNRYLVE